MKGFDVLKVKSAVKSHNKFDLSRTHLTTMDFGEIVPLFVEETVPGDKFNVNGEFFSRMAPLVKPTYGKFSFKTVAAFVPYHQVAVDSDAWLAGKTTWEGTTPVQRWFSVSTLAQLVTQSAYGSAVTSADTYDVVYKNGGGVVTYFKYNAKGKYLVKILNSLGYSVPEGIDMSSSAWTQGIGLMHLSAYPLLAFFKLYNDYMSQSQRFNTSTLTSYLRSIKYNIANGGIYNSTGEITRLGITNMFGSLFLNYENDYFTSAWQLPSTPLASTESVQGFEVPGGQVNGATSNVTNAGNDSAIYTNTITVTGTTKSVIAQRALDFLKSFDDWVRRNNYSGSRAVQQIFSRFGVKTDDYKSHYAQVLSTDSLPVQVGDVTATADASGVPLGDYAGKGIMSGNKSVSVQVSDYGLILILGYFTVRPMNSFGSDRRVLRNSPLDYYNPEFDGLGADAISVGEVWSNPLAVSSTTADNAVFGYTERYNSYRYGRDVITGEFRDYRKNGDMNVWHTGRNLNDLREAGTLVAQSTAMNTLPQTDSEYNRIFSLTSGDENHFYVTAKFNVEAIRPMLNLNQVPRLGEGDTTVPRNGNVIS